MDSLSDIILVGAVLNASIGAYVLFRAPQNSVNQSFFIFACGTAGWMTGYSLTILTRSDNFFSLLNTGGLLLVIGITRFAELFPSKKKIPIAGWIFWTPLMAGGAALIISHSIILHIEFPSNGSMHIVHGPLIELWSVLLLTYIFISFLLFIQSYVSADTSDKERLWYISAGMVLFAFSAILFDAILPGIYQVTRFNYIGPLSSSLVLVATAYAILKHNFLDIYFVLNAALFIHYSHQYSAFYI